MLVLYLNADAMAAMILCGLTIAVSAFYRSSKGNVLVSKTSYLIFISMAPEPVCLGLRRILPAQHIGRYSKSMEGVDLSLEWPQHDSRRLR